MGVGHWTLRSDARLYSQIKGDTGLKAHYLPLILLALYCAYPAAAQTAKQPGSALTGTQLGGESACHARRKSGGAAGQTASRL